MNGVAYAYLGDAYYELAIRKHIIKLGYTNGNILHKKAINYTCGTAQAQIINHLIDNNILTEEEIAMYKHGRNSANLGNKKVDAKIYHQASGFESLIGELSIKDEKRAIYLIEIAILFIESGRNDGKKTK